eukprot:scaffold4623_cov142-Skeletonema_menzelii.AAC.8
MNYSPESLSMTQRLASPRPPPPPPPTEESLELEESSDESDELEESSDPAAAQNFDMREVVVKQTKLGGRKKDRHGGIPPATIFSRGGVYLLLDEFYRNFYVGIEIASSPRHRHAQLLDGWMDGWMPWLKYDGEEEHCVKAEEKEASLE